MTVKCFWLAPTERVRLALRRFVSGSKCEMHPHRYHEAMVPIGEVPARWGEPHKSGNRYLGLWLAEEYAGDSRWPAACVCGHAFGPGDSWQVFQELIYTRSDGGETTLRDAPAGAIWDAWWFDGHYAGPDGHDWMIDGRASNCTMPDDDVHRCWVRHGEPPNLTVDKNGHTCAAGAGSIQTPKWHGFLRNGELVE